MRLVYLSFICCSISVICAAQPDTANQAATELFRRITQSIHQYRLDTSAAPDDKLTHKITELRDLKGGFNINEAISFKIAEDREKNELPKADLDKLAAFFNSGKGKLWLDNAITWIYRRNFTYREIRQMVRFYKTSSGQKMAREFPTLMLQSLRAAELIKEMYIQQK